MLRPGIEINPMQNKQFRPGPSLFFVHQDRNQDEQLNDQDLQDLEKADLNHWAGNGYSGSHFTN